MDFTSARAAMIEHQIAGRGLAGGRLLDAFRAVPREAFVPDHLAAHAYDDSPLPIECGQTISQPYIVALMLDAAAPAATDRALEVGAGSGYAAVLLGQLVAEVIAVERHPELARLAAERMIRLGYANVEIVHGDGTEGLADRAPFDIILAAASGSHVPEPLKAQLAPGGRLVMPLGQPGGIQRLVKLTRAPAGDFIEEDLGEVRFVPLIGAHGWAEDADFG